MEQTPFPGTRKTKRLWRTWHYTEDTGKTLQIRQMPRRPATVTLAKNLLTNSLFLATYDTTQNLSFFQNCSYQDLTYGSVSREDGDGPYPTCLTLLSMYLFPTHFPATLLIQYSSSNPHPSIHPLILACPSSIYPPFQICLLKINCEASSHFSLRIQFNSLEKFRSTSKWMTENPGFHPSQAGSLHWGQVNSQGPGPYLLSYRR